MVGAVCFVNCSVAFVRNNDFDIYSVDYVASQLYSALAHMSEKARQACDTRVTSVQWLDYFVKHFAAVKGKISYEKFERYKRYNVTAALAPGLPLTHNSGAGSSRSQSPAPPVKAYTEQQLAYFRTQVYVNDIMSVLKVKGKKHRECASNCPRRHMSDLLRAPYSADSLCDQLQSVLKDKVLAVKVAAAVRADKVLAVKVAILLPTELVRTHIVVHFSFQHWTLKAEGLQAQSV